MFALISAIIFKKISKEFYKRLIISLILEIFQCFHLLYFKTYAVFYIFDFLEGYFENNMQISVFKLFLMIYYIIYENFSKFILFHIFKEVSMDKSLSYNILIFVTKFVNLDILSIKVLNVLTIPLTDIISWVFFIYYMHSIISVYSRRNCIKSLFMKFYVLMIRKNIETDISLDQKEFDDLHSGCVFETNLIIFLRIISFKSFNYFFIYTTHPELYMDCSLKEAINNFEIYDSNTILLMTSHTLILVIMGVIIYGYKRKDILFNYQIERTNIFGRLLLFIICFSYADYTLQIYKALN